MLQVIIQLMGGVGLFLLGMSLMTDSLKAMTGKSLRQWLGRFTGSPLKAMMSGIGFTLVIQSSTATTLATIGFVSARVLSSAQAIGVIIGANIGTTSTGWMVAFLGLKFSIASLALPLVGIGAMMKLLGKNSTALLGLALAGFGLLFIGIDVLQIAMADFAQQVDLSRWSDDSFRTQFLLVMIGIIMTVLLQSSSATITATLAALANGAIDLSQALVIGQNIEPISTAILAAIGATVSAKRTAAIQVIFNIVTAVVAFFVLMPATLWLAKHQIIQWDDTFIIAFFHTAFSVLGAMMFMPFTQQFQRILEKLIPEKDAHSQINYLDESLFAMPAVAIATAQNALCQGLAAALKQVIHAGQGHIQAKEIDVQPFDHTLILIDTYLNKMPTPQAQSDQQHLMDLLQFIVYCRMIREDLLYTDSIDALRIADYSTFEPAMNKIMIFVNYLEDLPEQGIPQHIADDFLNFGNDMKAEKENIRLSIIKHSALSNHNAANALDLIVAHRWFDRFMKHNAKMIRLLAHHD